MSRHVLVTGAAGFIGSHLVEHLLKTTDWTIVGLDRLDETADLARLDTFAWRDHPKRFRWVWHDLKAPINTQVARRLGMFDIAFHLAASTHVDRSIADPALFVADNVLGTCHLLEWVRAQHCTSFVQFSTDEVFGPAAPGVAFRELDACLPTNPYAASKLGAEALVLAYANTYGTDALITRSMNVFGERQHREKFIPKVIWHVIRDLPVDIHTDRHKNPGSRFYVHAHNVAAALVYIVEQVAWKPGEIFHLGGEVEVDNLTMARRIAEIIGKPLRHRLESDPSSRPGHDLRYALDTSKLASFGFTYPKTFDESLEKTVRWYLDNLEWL